MDTAANTCYYHFDNNGVGYCPYVNENCSYYGTETDEINVQYQIFPEDVKNAMSDAYCFDCVQDYLTLGQVRRMREKIESFTPLVQATTTVASLYEPYAGEYFDPNNPNDPLYKPLFQPGFEYRFFECDCNCLEPAPYEDISFTYTQNIIKQVSKYETDFSIITHPNHSAIHIDLISQCISGQNTRRCYDNYNRKPT